MNRWKTNNAERRMTSLCSCSQICPLLVGCSKLKPKESFQMKSDILGCLYHIKGELFGFVEHIKLMHSAVNRQSELQRSPQDR